MSAWTAGSLSAYVEEIRSQELPPAQAGCAISAVVATYNRCPFGDSDSLEDNPLVITLTTLLAQEGVAQVIVVDDGSTDATPVVLDVMARHAPNMLQVVRLKLHAGSGTARNAGLRLARHPLILMLDDDMILPPGFAGASAALFRSIQEQNDRIGALTLPYYTRSGVPRAAVPQGEFGSLHLEDGYFTTNFDCVPSEVLPPAAQLPGLLSPIRTAMVSGYCLFSRAALTAVGGYPDLAGWTSAYSDQLVVSAELHAAGWHVYHAADPRLAAIHLKFGAKGRYTEATDGGFRPATALGRTIAGLVGLAGVARVNTGARVADHDFPAEVIGLFFACYAARSRAGGRAWARRTYADYVLRGGLYTLAYQPTVNPGERRAQWREGLARGALFAVHDQCPSVVERVYEQLRSACADVGEPIIDSLF